MFLGHEISLEKLKGMKLCWSIHWVLGNIKQHDKSLAKLRKQMRTNYQYWD